MRIKSVIFVFLLSGLFIAAPEPLLGQRASRQVRQAERKQAKKDRVGRRDYEKAKKRMLKEHINRQTPEVRERMKQNQRDSRRNNKPTRPPFYKRWFSKKPN